MTLDHIRNELRHILEAEKWNKYQLGEYNLSRFQELDGLLDGLRTAADPATLEELRSEAAETLKRNEHHISAHYIAAVLGFETGHAQEALRLALRLAQHFQRKEKHHIVEHICRRALAHADDPLLLRTLVAALRSQNKHAEIEGLLERLLRLEPDDTELVLQLAGLKEKHNKPREALRLYRTALSAFIRERRKKETEEVWERVISLTPDFLGVLLPFEDALTAAFDRDFVFHLLQRLSQAYPDRKDLDTLILLQKRLLHLKPDDKGLRNRLIELYSQKHHGHSQLGAFLISSGLKQWWGDVFQAIDRFERFIQFDVGTYVWHQSWGVGRVKLIQESSVTVDFERDPDHRMTFEMALSSLTVLPPDHIKAMKRFRPDELRRLLDEDPVRLMEILLLSQPHRTVTVETVRSELTDGLLPQDQWNRWWNRARKAMKASDRFAFPDSKTIRLVERLVPVEEELLRKFEDAPDFASKADIAEQALALENAPHRDPALYQAFPTYFLPLLASPDPVESVRSYLVLSRLRKVRPDIPIDLSGFDLPARLRDDETVVRVFNALAQEEKKEFLGLIDQHRPEPYELYLKLLRTRFSVFHPVLLDRAEKALGRERITEFLRGLLADYKDHPDVLLGFGRHFLADDGRFDRTEVYTNLLYLVAVLGRKIRNGENEEENRRIQKNAIGLLFNRQGPNLISYIVEKKKAGSPDAQKLVDLALDNAYLPDKHKKEIVDEVRKLENIIIA